MSTYAQVEHVDDAWTRHFASAELDRVQHLIDRAERMISREIDVPARLLSGLTTLDRVRDAVVEMVLRVLRNAAGIRSETTGPFSKVIDQSVASGRMELTRAERRLLGMIDSSGAVAIVDPALPRVTRYPTNVYPDMGWWS